MKHELKYLNIENWLAPIRAEDPAFSEGLEKIHDAICMADDIADHQIKPDHACEAVWCALIGMDILFTRPSYWPRIKKALQEILECEKNNLKFVPGKFDIEDELQLGLGKASLVSFYFEALCCLHPDIETPENIEWVHRFKEYCLIMDDCADILSETFEDLRNCRRNYVVLKYFGYDCYSGWKQKKEDLIKKAKEVKEETAIENPADSRLQFFIGDLNGNGSSEN